MTTEQPGKTTPIRVVHDLKWLNSKIKSVPNLEKLPAGVPQFIRKWRAERTQKIFMLDIRKAYNNIEVDARDRPWLGIRLPDDPSIYRITKLPFGLNIAGKVLSTILEHILPEKVFVVSVVVLLIGM
jgi:hypothetical protein